MATHTFSGFKKARYTTGREIGRGGEGTVYEVNEDPELVIKVYNEELPREKESKLQFMASFEDAELRNFAAWPVDIVRNHALRVCGFVMKKLEGFVPLHMLFSPLDRKKIFPDKGYDFLALVAKNVATAFLKVHQLDIVIGDVNEGNVLVNASGKVTLIDCDSFQIKNGGHYYFCEVGITRYTPPELLAKGTFHHIVRTPATDSFSLAVLIFQLLFLGRHPFTGINLTGEDIDEEKAIRTMEFAYSLRRANKKLSPAKNSFEMQNLSWGVIELFHEAFETLNNRPSPWQWMQELEVLGREMTVCSKSTLHTYPKKLKQCPWCRFNEQESIVYFLDDSYLDTIPELTGIEQFVHGFKFEQIEITKLSDQYNTGDLRPTPIDKKFIDLKKNSKILMGVTLLLITALCFISLAFILLGIILLIIINTALPMQSHLRGELVARRGRYEVLKTNFKKAVNAHNNPPNLSQYNQSAQQIMGMIGTFRGLPAEFADRKKRIEEKHYNVQYEAFLRNFDIRTSNIPSFGDSKKELLFTNGISSAADIGRLNQVKINGIGPKNMQLLFDWQRQVAADFTYSPDYININKDISLVTNDIGLRKRKLETDIKASYLSLHNMRANILSVVVNTERSYADQAKKVYQAELDLEAFKAFMKLF